MPQPVIEARDVVKVYRSGVIANRSLSLEAHEGEILGLLGPNGAGKTTFVRMVMGLLRPSSGTIRLLGVDVERNPTFPSTKVGYYAQHPLYLWAYKVRELLYHAARLKGMPSRATLAEVNDLVERFGAGRLRERLVGRLSGGERRLVLLLSALVGKPPVLVLDEPTNELDPILRHSVWNHLLDLRQSRGTTILLVTHNVFEAERVLDRVIILDSGEVKASGTPGELRRRLGERVRLEVRLAATSTPGPGQTSGPADAERLASVWRLLRDLPGAQEVRPGQIWAYADPSEVSSLLHLVTAPDVRMLLEDYRVIPPTLEDVYVAVTRRGFE